MTPQQAKHSYAQRRSKKRLIDLSIIWTLRMATYGIILAAGYLFLDIVWNGSKALVTGSPPFINLAFLTQKPQTLHVYEPKEIVREQAKIRSEQLTLRKELRDLGMSDAVASNEIQAQLKLLKAQDAQLDEQRKAGRLLFSDQEYRLLEQKPDEANFAYSNYAYSGGGVGPAIIGTSLLVLGSIAIALTLGVLCAVYLSEYSRPGPLLQAIRLSILNLSGVPSIVFGLFGFGFFVLFFGWGVSMIAGWFTLAIMALPVIITASEESMRAIPRGFREGSLALGASKWTSIRTNVLPYALPGILTSSIMGIARVAGETAPIMFTAAFALRDQLPWEGLGKWTDFFFQGVMALPYHIYVVSAKIPQNEYTKTMQYGAAFVFLIIVGFFALSSILLRIHIRKKYQW